jgi:hypothetical protein
VQTSTTCVPNCGFLHFKEVQKFSSGMPIVPFCVTNEVCEAIGQTGWPDSVWRTSNAGRSWVGQGLPGVSLQSIYCVSVLDCSAGTGGGAVYFTSDAGKSWIKRPIPQWRELLEPCGGNESECSEFPQFSSDPANSLFCWTKSHCIVGSSGTAETQFIGRTTTLTPYSQGSIVETFNAGRTWQTQSIPGNVSVTALDCGHGDDCWAVGQTSRYTSGSNAGVILKFQGK